MTPAGAGAEDADFAIKIWLRAEEFKRPFEVAEDLFICHAACRSHFGTDVFRRTVAIAEIKIRRNRRVPVMGEPARAFTIPFVPSRRVVNNHHSRMASLSERARVIGIDGVSLMSLDVYRFRRHAFVHIGLIHATSLYSVIDENTRTLITKAATGARVSSVCPCCQSRGKFF